MPNRWVAALLHAVDWKILENQFYLSEGISIERTRGSHIGWIYQSECEQNRLDYGDPYDYEAHILIEPNSKYDGYMDFGDPYGLLDRLCNIIAVVTAQPIAMCRVLWSDDQFKTYLDSDVIYNYGTQTEFLVDRYAPLTDYNKRQIREAWRTAESAWAKSLSRGRLTNALTYFYFAWRSHYLEQVCLNLAIVIELLFAPHSHSETSHQISYNAACFLGKSREERENIYKEFKQFYNVRSSIVHGGIPDGERVINNTVSMFRRCSALLLEILLDQEVASAFDDEAKRKELMDKLLFER